MSDHPHKPVGTAQHAKAMENISSSMGPQVTHEIPAPVKEDLKDHVKGDVEFVRYVGGNLIYEVINTGLEFPVPVSDVGNATFLCRDRAMLFMRYIRKHLELKNSGAQK
jgi:hypothetical protein